MKTLLILLTRYPAYGGIETVTTLLANRLVERYRMIICSECDEHKEELLPRLDTRIRFLSLPHHTPGYDAENAAAFRRILIDEEVNIILYQDCYFPNEYLLQAIPEERNIKLVVAEHSSPNYIQLMLRERLRTCPLWRPLRYLRTRFFSTGIIRKSQRRRSTLYAQCDRYVVLAESLKTRFAENCSAVDLSKLCAIGNPVSYESVPVDFSAKSKQVLFIGQFVQLKGIDRLLRIWHSIEAQLPDWELVLVGDGPEMPKVKESIARLKLSRVRLEGFRSNIRDYCTAASVLCVCSTFEGFPMVIPEAMCSGVVPLAFKSFDTLTDLIEDTVSGCAIPPYDEREFAQRLLHLLKNDGERAAMAQAALRQSAAFEITRIVKQWIQLFDSSPAAPTGATEKI